jgi:transposase
MIRSTRHKINNLNTEKTSKYFLFLEEYSRVVNSIVDNVWIDYVDNNNFNIPKYLDYKLLAIDTNLSARALQCACEQSSAFVRSVVEKQRRVEWVNEHKGLLIKNKKFTKPAPIFHQPQLSSKCANLQINKSGEFLGFLELKSIGSLFGKIRIPLNKNSRVKGSHRKSFLISKRSIQIAWDIEPTPIIKGNRIIGLDQGYKTVVTMSDGQISPKNCNHGHSLESIIEKLSNKKKGSNAFKKSQAHRKNFVNWSINQLDFSNLKELRLEKVVNIRKGVSSSRKMSHWSNPEIRDKIKRRCEELEVPIIEQSCAYRSQRCNQCGLVRKANRNGKNYTCNYCFNIIDADLNAAKNHEIDLPPIPFSFIGKKYNLKSGFFWKLDGFYSFDGVELLSPTFTQLPI